MMAQTKQTGYLLLADISGYTSFVAKTEIEHANLAISLLMAAIIEELDRLLTVAKLEGDAVFAYVAESNLEGGGSPARADRPDLSGISG